MTRLLTAIGTASALLAVAAQAAAAQPPASSVEEVSATAEARGDGSTATATATCPGGTKAAGGGFDVPSSAEAMGLVYESVKVQHRSWRASVQLFDSGEPSSLTLTTYVYCRAHLTPTKTSSETVATDGQVQVGPTASAACPGDDAALAGGFRMPPPLLSPAVNELIFDSVRSGLSGWDSRVATGPAGPSFITSEAYCSRREQAPLEAEGFSEPVGFDSQSATATAACPAGMTPASGGFAQPDGVPVSFFVVYSSRRVGDSWQVQGLHSGGAPAVALRATAYCA